MTQQTLDGLPDPKPKRKTERRKQTDSSVRDCFTRFHDEFVDKFNPNWRALQTPPEKLMKPLLKGGKDGKHFQHMLATWGRDNTLALIEKFFSSTDTRITRSDYTVGALYNLAQYLLLDKQRTNDTRTAHNVDAAHRAMRPQR